MADIASGKKDCEEVPVDDRVVLARKKVMFYKHHDECSDMEDGRIILPRDVSTEVQDAEELTANRPANLDLTVTHSQFKSSRVQGAWRTQKRKSNAEVLPGRRISFRLQYSNNSSILRQSRSRKGLSHIINSLVSNMKLTHRYDDKLKLDKMYLSNVKLLKTVFISKEERQEKVERLKSNIATIDEKVRQIDTRKGPVSNSDRKLHVMSDDRVSLPSITDVNDNMVRFGEQEETQEYFRRWVRVVMIVLRWISVILKISENKRSLDRELKSFTDIAAEIERLSEKSRSHISRGPTFDKNNFVINKEITLSYDVRRILTLGSVARTPAMLQQVMHGLQSLQSLAEYPLHIQEKLCKVAWYQQVEPKRAILRQGHFAEFFYFILSGQAFVKKMVENEKTKEPEMHTVARLTKGQCFGEVALLYRTTRTATVESATAMELLMVSGEDFIRIFTRTGNPDEEPAYVVFLRQIPVFFHWPLEKIKSDPGSCFLHYFKRGSVVCLDSVESEWIYIIKEGCCEVLQKLDAVKPRSEKCLAKVKRQSEITPVLPRADVLTVAARVENGGKKSGQKLPIPHVVFHAMKRYFDGLRQEADEREAAEKKRIQEEIGRKGADKSFRKPNTNVSFSDRIRNSAEKEREEESGKLPSIEDWRKGPSSRGHVSSSLYKLYLNNEKSFVESPTESDLLEMYEPVDMTARCKKGPIYSVRKGSVYVTIELLQSRDVFGLNTLNFIGETFEKASPVCLISRGAEIIMLSKKLFTKYANDDTRHLVKEHIKKYPGEGTMQMNLQSEVDWHLYKNNVVTGFLTKKSHKKTLL